jgi:hypothetical protein
LSLSWWPAGSQRATISADSPEELPRLITLPSLEATGPRHVRCRNLPERDVQEEA